MNSQFQYATILVVTMIFNAGIASAQFDEQPKPTKENPAVKPAANPVSKSLFKDLGDGTFQHTKTGLIWMADPRAVPVPKTRAAAEKLVASIKSGQYGLKDQSQPGDWRLPTTTDWDSAYNREINKLYKPFHIGWDLETRGVGYIGVGIKSDRWGGEYDLTMWGDGGRDSAGFGTNSARIWPVRMPKKNVGKSKDLYDFDSGKIVFALDQPVKVRAEGRYAFEKELAITGMQSKLRLVVLYVPRESYYEFELHTPAIKSFDDGGTGTRSAILLGTNDWYFRRSAQTLYANGVGLENALKDFRTKLNGIDGQLSINIEGDVKSGKSVVTIKTNR